MATQVPIEIFNIAQTVVNRQAVRKWLDFLGASDFVIPDDEAVTDPALLIAIAAKRCYKSFTVELNPNLSRVRSDWGEYIDNILKSGHGSVLEHSVYTWAIENVSRVFTGEMNRHRAGWAISEGSMRFIRFSDAVPYWEPESIRGSDVLNDKAVRRLIESPVSGLASMVHFLNIPTADVEAKKHATRLLFSMSFDGQRDMYKALEEIWKAELAPESKFKAKKEITSMMRRTIGMGCATGGVWTGNIRALRHVMTMRCEPAAEEEILHVFSRIAQEMLSKEPMLIGDFAKDEHGYWRPKYRKI